MTVSFISFFSPGHCPPLLKPPQQGQFQINFRFLDKFILILKNFLLLRSVNFHFSHSVFGVLYCFPIIVYLYDVMYLPASNCVRIFSYIRVWYYGFFSSVAFFLRNIFSYRMYLLLIFPLLLKQFFSLEVTCYWGN